MAAVKPSSATTIPFDQIGVEADKQANGSNSGIAATADGAELRATFQDLVGSLSADGLWLRSTAEATADAPFRVMASGVGRRLGVAQPLADRGVVKVEDDLARLVRPGLIEEYSVSTDGVRQDFVLLERLVGTGLLRVELAVAGATASASGDGISLVLDGSGRKLAYSRLHVSDAAGRTLAVHLEAPAANRIAIIVDDTNARWPLRIDPTFSDADWVSRGIGHAGLDSSVNALAVSGSDLYVGGAFTTTGGVITLGIAKWDGSTWSPLSIGLNNDVYALAMSGSDLYVGGDFTTAGGKASTYLTRAQLPSPGPEINVQGNSVSVASGDTTPSAAGSEQEPGRQRHLAL